MKSRGSALFRLVAILAMQASLLFTYSTALAATPDYRYWDPLLAPGSTPGYAWVNGSIGAGYTEGQAVPMNLKITGLTAGTWGFNISYDWYDEGKDICGIWKIVEYDVDILPSGYRDDVTPAEDLDAQFPDAPAGNRMYVGATGGTVDVTNIGASVQDGTTGLIKRHIPVTFTVTGSNVTAYFYFGVYLSLKNENGAACQGLTAFPGKSSQTDINATPVITGATMIGGGGTISIDSSSIAPAAISGLKYYDLDGDHTYDATEPLLQGWQIKVCTTSSCTTIVKSTLTNENGQYSFNLANGTYYACETLQTNWVQSEPNPPGCYGPIIVDDDQHPNMNFGNYLDADWGDLPETYGTLYPNGAYRITGTLNLGTLRDIEPQGQPSATALGDNNLNTNDEEGVTLTVFTDVSKNMTLQVVCSSPSATTAWVVVWVDWDRNGSFATDGSEITFDQAVNCSPAGTTNTLSINYGSFASAAGYIYPNSLYYRTRLYTDDPGSPAPTGGVTNGEVEDNYFAGPTAVSVSEPAAISQSRAILVSWQTFDESKILSFKLYRSTDPAGTDRILVYSTQAVNKGQFLGYYYHFTDVDVQLGFSYTYWLDVLLNNGSTETMDPASAFAVLQVYLPQILR